MMEVDGVESVEGFAYATNVPIQAGSMLSPRMKPEHDDLMISLDPKLTKETEELEKCAHRLTKDTTRRLHKSYNLFPTGLKLIMFINSEIDRRSADKAD